MRVGDELSAILAGASYAAFLNGQYVWGSILSFIIIQIYYLMWKHERGRYDRRSR